MKTKIVLTFILAIAVTLSVSAQRVENDDMYFRSKDRELNRAIETEGAYASVKTKKHNKQDEGVLEEETENTNPTDSYSARSVNPEFVSRSKSEKASEDEQNYYLEGYSPSATSNFNNSYYNNVNWASSTYYANAQWSSPYYGMGFNNPWMSSYYSPWMSPYGGYYDSWNSPYYSGFARSSWGISFIYGNYWSPYNYGYGYGYGGYPYFGYANPSYYYGNNSYYYNNNEPSRGNYGKRSSQHSAVVTPTQAVTRTRSSVISSSTDVSTRTRIARPAQDDYYVRPARRTSVFNSGYTPTTNSTDNSFMTPNNRPTRSRDNFPSYTPSQTPAPSYSPPRGGGGGGSSGGSGGSGGGSHPRGRG